MIKRAFICIAILLLSPLAGSAEAIKIGMTTALTGPAAELGLNMRAGIQHYFDNVNKQGGISGVPLELIVRDDGYEPERAALNMHQLIEQDGVLAIIGNVGTPTAIVSVPIAEKKKTLLFGAYSGASVLRPTPANRYVINYRPSYAEETEEIVKGLLEADIKPSEIAFFTQRDAYGDEGYQGVIKALNKFGFKHPDQLIHGRYSRNTLNVENAVAVMLDGPITPKAVIMAGGYAPSAKFIKLLQQEIPDLIFVNLSFVSPYSLKQVLVGSGDVIVMQSVPSLESSLPIVLEYISSLKKSNIDAVPNSISLEGFIVAKIFHQGLLNIKGKITKESIIDGLEGLHNTDIGLGAKINFNHEQHQAIHHVWMTHIKAGNITEFTWPMLEKSTDN